MCRPKIFLVAGARPNFMKIAPIVRALRTDGRLDYRIVHTGQHYDREMSDVFFEELGIPRPDFHLNAGGGSHAEQTAKIMVAFEKVCGDERPNCVLVVGDVNSTLACSIVAKKMYVPVGHVEAGLRSGDMRMPEEINRRVTDSISDWFFATEPAGVNNLMNEGRDRNSIYLVGNVMVDNLFFQRDRLESADISTMESTRLKATVGKRYGVVTLHRPSNVDDETALRDIISALDSLSVELPLIFPVHPRTRKNLDLFGIEPGPGTILMSPMSYMDFLNLWKDAQLVITDSGGLQEETTALGISCVTTRENTERPITVEEGTNVLAGTNRHQIVQTCLQALHNQQRHSRRPRMWDGQAAARIVDALAALLETPQVES